MALRLEGAVKAVEKLMGEDFCTITEDVQGATDDVLDPVTLELVPPVDDSRVIYSGKCIVSREDLRHRPPVEVAGLEMAANIYTLAVPLRSPDLRLRQTVVMTRARDKTLVGKTFSVVGVERGSFVVWRRAALILEETPRG